MIRICNWLALTVILELARTPYAEGAYNMINCDPKCKEGTILYNGTLHAVCEDIDPVYPNNEERGYLWLINFGRMFPIEYESRFGRTFHDGCILENNHPLWEFRGATEAARFSSQTTRDCSEFVHQHNTCVDYCYADDNETRSVYKPIEGCNGYARKQYFEPAAKELFEDMTGNTEIHFNAEARCFRTFPCYDTGHCGVMFKPNRFWIGVGIARDKPDADIWAYMKGTRNWEAGLDDDYDSQLAFWQNYEDSLHRITTGSHIEKCLLDQNCYWDTMWQNITFVMNYAHWSDNWVNGYVHYQGVRHTMDVTMSTDVRPGVNGTYHAYFEKSFPWPDSCESYYFTVEANDGNTYRLPEDSNYYYSTYGKGCNYNHYYETAPGNLVPDYCPSMPLSFPSSRPTQYPTFTPEEYEDQGITFQQFRRPQVFGDPHFQTWHGDRYDFHGVCDLVLLHNPDFNNNLGMDIHIRTKRTHRWSYVGAAAISIGHDTLEVVGGKSNNEYYINGMKGGEEQNINISGYPITFRHVNAKSREFTIDLGLEQTIDIVTWNGMVKVQINGATDEDFGGCSGLMGSFQTGLKMSRDGSTIIDDFNSFGLEWQVLPTEPKLFHNIEGPQSPKQCEIASAADMRRRLGKSAISWEDADLLCAEVDQLEREHCVFDVMATNDADVAGAYLFNLHYR